MPIKGLKGGIGSKALGYGLGAAEEATDAEFNQTVLLLHGDGSEGEGDTAALGDPNYKAFKDNSTSAHAITVQGDAYGNDFSPYYYADGYWSNFFNGSGDGLDIANVDTAFGTSNDFTLEFWFNVLTLDGTNVALTDPRTSNFSAHGLIWINNAGRLYYYAAGANRIGDNTTGGTTYLDENRWYHVALVRYSGTTTLYLDGSSEGSFSDSINYVTTTSFHIGERYASSIDDLHGYVSNLRLVNGTAVYTSTFTPPTSPLTAITNTQLLTCQSNRFKDTSGNSGSSTLRGTPKISTNTPFTVTKTANVGSGFFDGSGDGLNAGTSSEFLPIADTDFTFEAWVYLTATPGAQAALIMGISEYGTSSDWIMQIGSDLIPELYLQASGAGTTYEGSTAIKLNEWNHIAWSRSGTGSNNMKSFINGVEASSHTYTGTTVATGTTGLSLGSDGASDEQLLTGYIADARIINGTGLYTSDFTPPTSSLTAVTNTKLLTCQYSGAVRNVGFLDDSKYNHQITRNGDVSMGTFSPFSAEEGYWSIQFDPLQNSYITFADTSNVLDIGGADAHIELWYKPLRSSVTQVLVGKHGGSSSWSASNGFEYQIAMVSNKLKFNYNAGGSSNNIISTTDLNDGKWYHVAVATDSSNNIALFIDGTREATAVNAITKPATRTNFAVGSDLASPGNDTEGYVSNLRHVSGSNAYDPTQSSITVPTSILTAITGTQILTANSYRFKDLSTNDLVPTITSYPKIQPLSPFAPSRPYSKDVVGGSAYFDGSGDYLTVNSDIGTLTGDFTIECFFYQNTTGAYRTIWSSTTFYSTSNQIRITTGNSNDILKVASESSSSTIFDANTSFNNNEWNHIALVRSGTTLTLYLNGTSVGSATNSTSFVASSFQIGDCELSGSHFYFDGYISNVRVVNGTALYTSSFTPPTAPFLDSDSNYSNTTLLTRFDNAGIIDHTMKNNLETEGNVRISGQQTKFGTGSMYFDGTGDKLVIPYTNEFFTLGVDNKPFTIEVWAYPTNTMSGVGQIISKGGGTASWVTTSGAQYQWYINSSVVYWNFNKSGSAASVGGGTVTLNTWQHLAVTYDGTTTRTFLNGTQQNTNTDTYSSPTTRNLQYIGMTQSSGYTQAYYGYLDDFRITQGVARYTSNFTPPTQAFANR